MMIVVVMVGCGGCVLPDIRTYIELEFKTCAPDWAEIDKYLSGEEQGAETDVCIKEFDILQRW